MILPRGISDRSSFNSGEGESMINCKITQNHLGPYVDGELSDGTRVSIETHLAGCPDCRHELNALKKLERVLYTLNVPALSPFLHTRIMVRARKQRGITRLLPPYMAGRMPWSRLPMWISALSLVWGLVIGSVMGLSIYSPAQGPQPLVAERGLAQHNCMNEFLYGLNHLSPMDRGGIESVTLAVMENLK
jgi:anti-sigma factor RsiW